MKKRYAGKLNRALAALLAALIIVCAFPCACFAAENEYSFDSRYAGFLGQGLKHDERFKSFKKIYGIDVSAHQKLIDWKSVAKAGTQFVFVRIGYRGYVSGTNTEDEYAAYNISEALKCGLKVGVYFFSQAITVEEGLEEAEYVAEFLDRYGFSPACIRLPVVYDVEYPSENGSYVGRLYDAKLDINTKTDIAVAFLERIKLLGYEGMFYGSRSALNSQSKVRMSAVNGKYPIWLAAYTQSRTAGYDGPYIFWQYSCFGKVPGIEKETDLDVWYDDGVRPKTGWTEKDGGMQYISPETGKPLTGFQTLLGRTYYFDETGRMLTGWQIIDNRQYFFTAGGLMQTGEKDIGAVHCSFGAGGALERMWYFSGGKLYIKISGKDLISAGGMPPLLKKTSGKKGK